MPSEAKKASSENISPLPWMPITNCAGFEFLVGVVSASKALKKYRKAQALHGGGREGGAHESRGVTAVARGVADLVHNAAGAEEANEDKHGERKHRARHEESGHESTKVLDHMVDGAVCTVVSANIPLVLENDHVFHRLVADLLENEWIRSNISAVSCHDLPLENHWVHINERDHASKYDKCGIDPQSFCCLDRRNLFVVFFRVSEFVNSQSYQSANAKRNEGNGEWDYQRAAALFLHDRHAI
mmetsp:Transcript_33856/g.67393  ORF Transcript_33856/g.67393 Transcript_33856/m.67393 type:complete len:243 (+) Transcript_33856:198-926(+)